MNTHVVDVFGGPLGRWNIVLDGCIFCGQAKGIPTHGLQHILSLHALVATNDICNGVIAYMPHVQFATGVGEHGQAVEFLSGVIGLHGKTVIFKPLFLSG